MHYIDQEGQFWVAVPSGNTQVFGSKWKAAKGNELF